MKKSHILILLLFLCIPAFWSCSSKKYLRYANKSYAIGEYSAAIEKYRKAYKKSRKRSKEEKALMSFRLAELYQTMGEYSTASIWYKNAIRREYPDKKAKLYYAQCLLARQKFEDAKAAFESYLELSPNDREAKNGLEACQKAIDWMEHPSRYVVNVVKELNSKYRDFAPVYQGKDDRVVFTSSQESAVGKGRSAITGEDYTDLFVSDFEIQRQKWGKPELLDESFTINTGEEEGAACFSADGSQMFFTRCRYKKNENLAAEVYMTTASRRDWTEPIKLDLVRDSLIAAHPSLSEDGQTIYFVSDRIGGFGGKDIWKAERKGDKFGRPQNLGPQINTTGDEIFPCIHRDGTLYFSSNYHTGLGGYDIFKAEKQKNRTWKVENMGVPINSSGDDFGINFAPGEKIRGMFSSNRKGSREDDIYSFYLPPKIFQVIGKVCNKETNKRLDGATIRIIGTDGTMRRMRASGGKFQMKLNPETEYIFAAYKEGFLNDKARGNTIALEDSKDFHVELRLTPTDAPIKVDNINYEFGSYELLPESVYALDSLVSILNSNPTIVIELMSHTDFIGSDNDNSELSQKRAQSVVNYLIKKGIHPDRLVAKGYGETWPKKVTKKLAKKYGFLKKGDELNEQYIKKLSPEQQEIARAIDRRTEFRVLSTDFHEKYDPEPQK